MLTGIKLARIVQISFIIMTSMSFAQDSSYIYQYLDKDIFPTVDTAYYKKDFRLGKLRSEGWTIEEKNLDSASLTEIKGTDDDITFKGTTILHKVGVWKFYYGTGNVSEIDTILFSEGHFHGNQHFYSKDGTLESIVLLRLKNKIYTNQIYLSDRKLNELNEESMEQYDYDSTGKLIRKRIWINNELTLDEEYE